MTHYLNRLTYPLMAVDILNTCFRKRLFALSLAALAIFQPAIAQPADQSAKECSNESLQQLVQLIDDRLDLADDVARYKWTAHQPIEDLAREQAIIQSLGHQAGKHGLPVAWSEAFFRAQIEASKSEQRALFAKWGETHPNGFKNPPHLTTVTRPKLDAINRQLFAILSSTWGQIRNPLCQPVIVDLVATRQQASALRDPSALNLATAPIMAGADY